jgi:hypothetical protein
MGQTRHVYFKGLLRKLEKKIYKNGNKLIRKRKTEERERSIEQKNAAEK